MFNLSLLVRQFQYIYYLLIPQMLLHLRGIGHECKHQPCILCNIYRRDSTVPNSSCRQNEPNTVDSVLAF